MSWMGPSQCEDHCCECESRCSVTGFWLYSSDYCTLNFIVGQVDIGCESYTTHEDIDITLVITDVNGNEVPGVEYVDGVLQWHHFAPPSNKFYRATITLVCGYYTTIIRVFDYTTANPIVYGPLCSCCNQRQVDHFAITASGCCAFSSGTWALSAISSCDYYRESDALAAPSNGCTGACFSVVSGLNTYYVWPVNITILASMNTGVGDIIVVLTYTWRIYRWNGSTCVHSHTVNSQYTYTFRCNSSEPVGVDTAGAGIFVPGVGTIYTCPSPTVSIGVSDK